MKYQEAYMNVFKREKELFGNTDHKLCTKKENVLKDEITDLKS